MPVGLLIFSIMLLVAGGLVCAAVGSRAASNRIGPAVSIAAAAPAALSAAMVLWTGGEFSMRLPWDIPLGSFSVAVDPLSAFFVLAIAIVCAVAALYGAAYLESLLKIRNLGLSWFFYNVLFASMLLVVTARNGVLFLIAWEIMSLSSFFLVMFEHERREVREAGWTYLTATHLGTAFLLAMFAILGWQGQSLDFDLLSPPAGVLWPGLLFIMAVIGFGTKAGFLPMHVWLPEAHPAAPSHVSAVMSGVMIKTGIYGILRTLTFLGEPAPWWGWTLLVIGAVSGVLGVLYALAQHDLKRLLAYHSVENIGIICLGLGLFLLGMSTGNTSLAVAGLLGGMLHVWNHALFKSLLFLGAGVVAHGAGTLEMDRLGGLHKRMKHTSLTFLVGAAAISGLPPLNGFVSEFLIYIGAFKAVSASPGGVLPAAGGMIALMALALIGGLAAACFAKVYGVVFLGEGRSAEARGAHEAPITMRASMTLLAAFCFFLGLAGPLAVRIAGAAAAQMFSSGVVGPIAAEMSGLLWHITLAAVLLYLLVFGLWQLRRVLLKGRDMDEGVTWDCGYAAPSASMQYTASSFAWPIVGMFRGLVRPRVHLVPPEGFFPKEAVIESHTDDLVRRFLFAPLFRAAVSAAESMRWLQQGKNQVYVLYIAVTMLLLLIWKLR